MVVGHQLVLISSRVQSVVQTWEVECRLCSVVTTMQPLRVALEIAVCYKLVFLHP